MFKLMEFMIYMLEVFDWPVRQRRIFLLFLPITGPLWCAFAMFVVATMTVLWIVGSVFMLLAALWSDKARDALK